jgi:hypothetical protein
MRRLVAPPMIALALALLPSAVAAAAPRAVDFEEAVALPADAGAARAADGWRTSAPLRAPRRFDLLGVVGPGPRELELRVRRPGGGWTRWVHAHPGEPVWTGPARAYQLRARGDRAVARLHFVAIRGRARAAAPARASAGLRPAIVPRRSWDAGNDCPPRVTPAYGRIDFATVHHTVSLNAYGAGAVPGIVLAICRFHRNGNEWNDIGYNLLVDRFGRVIEGRKGGVAQPVIGAHAQGWNAVSTGVAAIGDFSGAGAPAAMLSALARTIAWKLSLGGVPATGSIVERSIGGDVNRYPPGALARFERIAGHRDGDLTSCPGAGLASQLPALREMVRRSLPAPRDLLTISPAPAPQPPGGPFLTGRLARADGGRPRGQALVLQRRLDGAWVALAEVRTAGDGIWQALAPLTGNAVVRALHPASGTASPAVAIPVRAAVRLRASRAAVRLGGAVELSGTTSPVKGRVRVRVERRLEGEGRPRFHLVRLRTVATTGGRFALTLRPPAAGRYRVTALTPTDRLNAAGRSRALRLQVLPRR